MGRYIFRISVLEVKSLSFIRTHTYIPKVGEKKPTQNRMPNCPYRYAFCMQQWSFSIDFNTLNFIKIYWYFFLSSASYKAKTILNNTVDETTFNFVFKLPVSLRIWIPQRLFTLFCQQYERINSNNNNCRHCESIGDFFNSKQKNQK